MWSYKQYVLGIIFFSLLFFTRGQMVDAAGELDDAFSVGIGMNNPVSDIAIQSNGKILVAGSFTAYNGTGINRIARINFDGTLDEEFYIGTGPSSYLQAVAIQLDGKIVISGAFQFYNGTWRERIARINADGSLDTSFNPEFGLNYEAYDIAIQPDGKILVVGAFTSYNGTARNYIARINSDGSLDATFNIGTGANGSINNIALQSDGKIVIGGAFTSYNGTARNYIARINSDGSLDNSFVPGTGTNNYINALAIQSDGKIFIGGYFATYNGTDCNRLARINTDGSLDASFSSGVGGYNIEDIIIQSDGRAVISGDFIAYDGMSRNQIARINTDGSLDGSFNPGAGANNVIYTSAIQLDGNIIIGGLFTTYNSLSSNRIARVLAGNVVTHPTLTTTPATSISSTTAQGNGDITATGNENPERFIQWGTVSGNYTNSCTAGTGGTGQYACQLTNLTPNTTYYIRAYATNSAGTTYGDELSFTTSPFSQSGTNQLSATIAQNMTLSCGTDIDLNGGTPLIPQTPATSQTTCTVTTNDENGYDLQLENDRGSQNTLYHNVQSVTTDGQITDKTRWNPTTPNATNYTGTGLAFGILTSTATKNTTWWGTGTTCSDANQLYAGIPATSTAIMEHTDYSNTPTDTTICYHVNVPSTQISGLYEGSVTYTATGRP